MRLRTLEPSYRSHGAPPGVADDEGEPAAPFELDTHVAGGSEPVDTLAQAARNLRTMIAAARLKDGRPPKTIVLLSAEAEPETALMAGNLAIASARSGWRTLLVDTSNGQAVQTRLFRIEPGVAVAPLEEVADLGAFVQQTAVPDLFLLSVGGVEQSNVAGTMDPQRFLEPLIGDFDLLLIDASHTSADCPLSEAAEAAIVVLRQDHSTVSCVGEMIGRLRMQGTPLLGTFLVA